MASLRVRAREEKAQARPQDVWLPFTPLEKDEADILVDRITKEAGPMLLQDPTKALLKPLRPVALGVNEVTRLVESRAARVIVMSSDAAVQTMCQHVAVMAEQLAVPICVVPVAPSELGAIFKLKQVSVFAFRTITQESTAELEDALIQLRSIQDFAISKASSPAAVPSLQRI
ncbi:hypothetical protein ACHHYP_09092 [Achlya hypogyna]|uniref:Ribosomal protein eL8/eL30/eS12/Gadd45 domain-containing protein n=1 Tax=Achlya hypogyna TaxID=1202772 RepID=A0A1V9YNX2_ACHHY|nr:hypothetical protein ACHHYP_09092 [Achlya hypogyna]